MLGAIIGDVIGSLYEFDSPKSKHFELLSEKNRLTDDSLMTIAVACACAEANIEREYEFKVAVSRMMREIGRQYPEAGYGGMFYKWLFDDHMTAYYGFGNGSAMRVSSVAWVAESLEQAETLARWSAEVTHNHPEGIKGAMAVASAIYLAKEGKSKEEIKEYIEKNYYALNFTLDEIRPIYKFDVTCQGSVPQAIACFLEAKDFEDTARNAVSLGGDGDTISAIACSIAEAYYGIPSALEERIFDYFDSTVSDYYFTGSEAIYG